MKIEDFKTGDIILFHTAVKWYKPMSWLSGLIRFFTHSYYNHVGVVVLNWGVPFLNEAIETGVLPITLKDRLKKGLDIRVIRPIKEIDERMFALHANDKLGHTGYDFSGLLWFQLIYQLTGHWLGHTGHHADQRQYCGEYAAYNYPEIFKEWWKTAPSEINNCKEFNTVFQGKWTVNNS